MSGLLRTPLPADPTLATWTRARHAHSARRWWALWNQGLPIAELVATGEEDGALTMHFAVDEPPKLADVERGAALLHFTVAHAGARWPPGSVRVAFAERDLALVPSDDANAVAPDDDHALLAAAARALGLESDGGDDAGVALPRPAACAPDRLRAGARRTGLDARVRPPGEPPSSLVHRATRRALVGRARGRAHPPDVGGRSLGAAEGAAPGPSPPPTRVPAGPHHALVPMARRTRRRAVSQGGCPCEPRASRRAPGALPPRLPGDTADEPPASDTQRPSCLPHRPPRRAPCVGPARTSGCRRARTAPPRRVPRRARDRRRERRDPMEGRPEGRVHARRRLG